MFTNFFSKNRVIYEVMWKNVAQPHRPQMAVQHMCFACCISKDTDTHSEWNTYCFSTATMITWTHLNIMFICTLPLLFKMKFYEFFFCLSVESAGVTPELSHDKQCSTTTLNTIMACNLETGFKEGFYTRPCYIEPMPPQLKYIKSQKHFNKTSYDTRGPNLIQLFIHTLFKIT
jgi:hypothetical protein